MKARLARLNHFLIPTTRSERDRYRNSGLARRLRPLVWVFGRLSREGRALSSMASVAMVFGADLGRSESHVLVLATFSLIAGALVFTRAYALSGVSVELNLPRRVTVGEQISIGIALFNDGPRAHHRIRTEPPLLPWDGRFTELPADIESLESGARKSTHARARFVERGAHQLDPFRAAALIPLGLSRGAALSTPSACFVVVPKVARVVTLTIPQNRRHQPGGVTRASRTGDATDLLGVRPYRAGDPLRDLHARSWARHGAPMVREYQEEYFTRIGVVVDIDASVSSPAHVEGALSLAAGVVANLCRGEALVDVLVTGEHVERLSLGRSLGSLDQALDVLAAVRSRPGFMADRLLGLLGPHLERLSAVVLVALTWDAVRSDFVAAIEARGVSAVVFVVADHGAKSARVTTLPLAAIAGGQELHL